MVKYLLLFWLIIVSLKADLLDEKILGLMDAKSYQLHQRLIGVLFQDRSSFYSQENQVDVVKVAKTLKENGLLNLFFGAPKNLTVTFEAEGSTLLAMKLIGDSLRSIGYSYFLTRHAATDGKRLEWTIWLSSEYAIDPVIFAAELKKRGCGVIDIARLDAQSWRYLLDLSGAFLNVRRIMPGEQVELKKKVGEHWLALDGGGVIAIRSAPANSWCPNVTFFDSNLEPLEVYRKDQKSDFVKLHVPQGARYIKISDIYTQKNFKEGLKVTLQGE